ncbi:MAG: hypothetical protein KAX38_07420, partial [Candidatus Krumholzibacteria bacterium]|nr:hypothetical protein [Candidatus Krumholzibacteria bacterium]
LHRVRLLRICLPVEKAACTPFQEGESGNQQSCRKGGLMSSAWTGIDLSFDICPALRYHDLAGWIFDLVAITGGFFGREDGRRQAGG